MRSRLSVVFTVPMVATGFALASGSVVAHAATASGGSGGLGSLLGTVTKPSNPVTTPITSTVQKVVAATHLSPTTVAPTATSHTATTSPRSATSSSAAPGSNATGIGLRVDLLDTCVSCTSASAKSGSSNADATGIRVLGNDLSAGSSPSTSTGSGSLISLPLNPVIGLAIADWLTSATANAGGSTSHSRASLVDVALLNGQIATIAVLESISDAAWGPSRSTGTSQTNGVDANLLDGALVLVLLHSQASSSAGSSVYLIGINGSLIGTAANGQGIITIPIPGITMITLLQTGATGGNGTTGSGGAIGIVTDTLPMVLGPGETGQVLGVGSSGGNGPSSGCPPQCGSTNPPGGGTQPGGSTQLPNTGASSTGENAGGVQTPITGAGLRLAGIVLVAVGLALAALLPRRRHSTI